MKKIFRNLILGEDGKLSKSEALSFVALIIFTIQSIVCLAEGSSEGDVIFLATMAGYRMGNQIANKTLKK